MREYPDFTSTTGLMNGFFLEFRERGKKPFSVTSKAIPVLFNILKADLLPIEAQLGAGQTIKVARFNDDLSIAYKTPNSKYFSFVRIDASERESFIQFITSLLTFNQHVTHANNDQQKDYALTDIIVAVCEKMSNRVGANEKKREATIDFIYSNFNAEFARLCLYTISRELSKDECLNMWNENDSKQTVENLVRIQCPFTIDVLALGSGVVNDCTGTPTTQ